MKRPRRTFHCLICRAVITHTNMGIESCRACGMFYRRTIKLKYRLECHCDGTDASKKENITACRKCRFEKMKDLMNRATADDINCVVDSRSRSTSPAIDRKIPTEPKENGIKIDKKRPESPVKDSKDDSAQETAEDGPGVSTIFEVPASFIDHSYNCEPSCSNTPFLNKMMKAYSTLCAVRKSFEVSCLHQREMFTELSNGTLNLRTAKYSEMAEFSKIFFIGLTDFAKTSFPEFNEISAEDRHALVQANFPLIQSMDLLYRSYHYFPDEDSAMASYTTFVSEDKIEQFFKDCPPEVNREEAVEIFRRNMDQLIKITKIRFRKLNPLMEEFVALFALALWNDYSGRLSTEISNLVANQRKIVMKELHVMYSQRGLKEYAPRLGELFCLLTNEEVFQYYSNSYILDNKKSSCK